MPSSAAGDPAGLPPSTVTDPADAADRPTARFSSVLLPAPFGPTRAATCPAGTASVHSRSAHVRPYLLLRSVVSMTFMPQAYAGRRNTDITRRGDQTGARCPQPRARPGHGLAAGGRPTTSCDADVMSGRALWSYARAGGRGSGRA